MQNCHRAKAYAPACVNTARLMKEAAMISMRIGSAIVIDFAETPAGKEC